MSPDDARARSEARQRVRHMREAAASITGYVARGRSAFDADSALRDAILYQLVVLGEAVKSALVAMPDLATAFPEVEWRPIARMRDRVAHHYWATDPEVVWATATAAVPRLEADLARVEDVLGG